MSEKRFPILRDGRKDDDPRAIPWSVAEVAYEEYRRRYRNDQSLERIAERGGFAISEMNLFYPGWREHV